VKWFAASAMVCDMAFASWKSPSGDGGLLFDVVRREHVRPGEKEVEVEIEWRDGRLGVRRLIRRLPDAAPFDRRLRDVTYTRAAACRMGWMSYTCISHT